ncbi:MAG: hypothetical protein Q8J64_06510 [Thermodesulfovibrionales bacterium]|nr:hypothetical protein [Thermodesulfovibrionales bacterium]
MKLALKRFIGRKPTFTLHVLIYEEDGVWVAHCLEMDIIASDPAQGKVEKDIIDLIRAQLVFAHEHGNMENIFTPAPPEDWAKLFNASRSCNLKKLNKETSPFKGVELCFA